MISIKNLAVTTALLFGVLLIGFLYFVDQDTFSHSISRGCSSKCNVILIVSDTLSAENMSVYGYDRETTPFLDSFFRDKGIIFENMWSTSHWTFPAMASLFHSRYASDITFTDIVKNQNTFTAVLKNGGIDIVSFLKVIPEGKSRGKAILSSIERNFSAHDSDIRTHSYTEHETNFVDAVEWIDVRESTEPYFMFIHDTTVHDPYDPPSEYRGLFSSTTDLGYPITHKDLEEPNKSDEEKINTKTAYDQEIRYLDDQLESFIESLGEELDDTVIIITADHGEAFGEHDNKFGHGPTHGSGKNTLYEEIIHIPLLVYAPGNISGISDKPVSLIDLAPTILNIFGIDIPDYFEGQKLTLGGASNLEDRILISEHSDVSISIEEFSGMNFRDDVFPDIPIISYSTTSATAVRREDTKVITQTPGMFEAYDLSSDLDEKNNLIENLSEVSSSDREIIDQLVNYLKKEIEFRL